MGGTAGGKTLGSAPKGEAYTCDVSGAGGITPERPNVTCFRCTRTGKFRARCLSKTVYSNRPGDQRLGNLSLSVNTSGQTSFNGETREPRSSSTLEQKSPE